MPAEADEGRRCGRCTLCCKIMEITELKKPVGSWCSHCDPGKGCRIYQERPDECRTFQCLWLMGEGHLGQEWKPDKSKLVLVTAHTGNGVEIRCDPGYPQAWRKEPFYSKIRQWAAAGRASNGTVIVLVGKASTLVAPEG